MTIPKKTKLLLFVVGLVASLMLVKAELIGFDKFSADPASFGPELLTYFGTDLQTEDKKNIEEFIVFWNTGTYLTDEEKKQIVVLANNFLERKLLAVPYMSNFLHTVLMFGKTNQPKDSFGAWLKGLANVKELVDASPSQLYHLFLNTQVLLDSSNVIFETPGHTWEIYPRSFKFVADKKLLVSVARGTLLCKTRVDTIQVKETMGNFNLLNGTWVGNSGLVTWERNGLAANEVYARLQRYTILFDRDGFTADTVAYFNRMYFKASLEGQLSLKIENGISGDLMTYPRFKTYKQRYSIANLYNNVNFDGGIEVKGARLLGFGSRENPVVVVFEKANANGKKFDFIKAVTRTVIIKKNELRASNAQVTINLKDDSLFHSNIDLIYNDAKQEVILVPNNVMISNSPYYDSYHKLSISTEQIGWKIGSDQLVVSGGFGVSLNRARFESENFFNIDYFDNLMGRDQQHPVFALRNFAKKMGDAPMTAQGFATFLRKNITETKMLLMNIAQMGYIFYDIEAEEITLTPKLREALKSRIGQIDYDVIRFASQTNGSTPNATIDLNNLDMKIFGIDNISVSDSQNVFIAPRGGVIVMKKNRDFSFDGQVQAGFFTFFGNGFTFNYDDFKFELNKVDSLNIDVRTNTRDALGRRMLARVGNTLESISGNLLIDEPNNKSGLKHNSQYPIFQSTQESYVYYDSPAIYNGVFNRKKFFFRIYPYTIDSLNQFEKADLKFTGQFESDDIFPPFEETLVVRPDNSLGFVHKTSQEGLRAYKGKGVFYENLDMSNHGLIGKGALTYLTSRTTSPGFFFFPDSMVAITHQFSLGEQVSGIQFPQVTGVGNKQKWYPRKDTMLIYNGEKPFTMFNGLSTLVGDLVLTPIGLIGNGTTKVENGQLVAKRYAYDARKFKSDTTDITIFNREQVTAFAADSVKAMVDMDRREGRFSKNGAFIQASLPEAKYTSFLDELVWHMNSYELSMTASRAMPLEKISIVKRNQVTPNDTVSTGALFVSNRADQDTLNFVAPMATYSIDSATIAAAKVKYILVADAQIMLDEGLVNVKRGGLFQPFHKGEIFVDRRSHFHRIYDADVSVVRGMDYKASGKYDYVDEDKNVETIFFQDVNVDKSKIETYAKATLTEPDTFKLSPHFDFVGSVDLRGQNHYLVFSGGVRPIHDCPGIVKSWLRFKTQIDPDSVVIPFGTPVFDINQSPLFTGTYLASDSVHIFPGFLSYHKFFMGDPWITTSGYLYYQKMQHRFIVTSPEMYGHADTTGNVIMLNKDFCMLEGSGKLSLASNFGRMEVDMAGTHAFNLEANKAKMDVVMTMDFFFNQPALLALATDLNTTDGLKPVDMSRKSFIIGLENLVGYRESQILLNEINLYGKVTTIPAALNHTIVLTDLTLEWNQDTKSFISKGDIGIGIVGGVQVHKKVKGFVEVVKRRSGDLFTLYIEPAEGKYFLFSFIRGTMHATGYSDAFVVPIRNESSGKRTQKGKRGIPHYNYVLTDRNVLGAARKRFAEIQQGDDPVNQPSGK
jgi:hypothetical protein